MADLKGRWALVTGASSGLGVDFAADLAERGANVILVARREDRLRQVQSDLQTKYGVKVEIVVMDLGKKDAPEALYAEMKEKGLQVDILINNAGFGAYGYFVDLEWERERQMLELDILTLVHLTKIFVREMKARNYGYILQIASVGAYQPSPYYATYAAAKSFVLHFGEALNYELRDTKVKVSVLSPGITATEFLAVAGQKPSLYQRLAMMQSRKVAQIGIKAMLKGKPSTVPGLLNALTIFSVRLMPRRLMALLANLLMKSETTPPQESKSLPKETK